MYEPLFPHRGVTGSPFLSWATVLAFVLVRCFDGAAGIMVVLLLKSLRNLCCFKEQHAVLSLPHVIPRSVVGVVIELCKLSRADLHKLQSIKVNSSLAYSRELLQGCVLEKTKIDQKASESPWL